MTLGFDIVEHLTPQLLFVSSRGVVQMVWHDTRTRVLQVRCLSILINDRYTYMSMLACICYSKSYRGQEKQLSCIFALKAYDPTAADSDAIRSASSLSFPKVFVLLADSERHWPCAKDTLANLTSLPMAGQEFIHRECLL